MAEPRPDSQSEKGSLVVGSPGPDPLHLARNGSRTPTPAPGSQFFPGHSASTGVESCRELWSTGKRTVLQVAGTASSSTDMTQEPCEPDLISQVWGTLPRGSLLVGAPALGLPGLASLLETSQSWL